MKIQIYSDLHADINQIYKPSDILSTKDDTDLYIDAGDTGEFLTTKSFYQDKFWSDKKVLFVGGNHTHYNYGNIESNQEELKKLFPHQNCVTYLQDDDIVIGDYVFLGCTLWSSYQIYGTPNLSKKIARKRMNDFKCIKFSEEVHLTPEICQTMFSLSLKYLHKRLMKYIGKKKAVVITHHAPSIKSCLDIYKDDQVSASYCSNLEQFMQDHQVFLWIHGHMHNTSGYQLGDSYVCCNPLGYIKYNEISGFVNNLIIDI